MMTGLISLIRTLHDGVFGTLERLGQGWLVELLARLAFAAVLLVYYLNSGLGKFDSGFLVPGFGAYISILGEATMTEYGFDVANIPLHLDLVVYAGSITEIVLPILIVIGLFTRVAALGMIFFVLVQSYVDVAMHGVSGDDVGAWFDNQSGALLMDQRTLWVFLLLVLVIKGAGALSLDRLISGVGRR